MGRIGDKLAELELELPQPPAAPAGVVLPFKWVRVSGGQAYVSGHGPLDGGEVLVRGKVGADVSPDRATEAARLTALSMFASLERELGDLDRVTGWVKALGLVNCAPGFTGTPGVINGFSDLVIDVWGEAGRHARSAIGASELPFEMSVEVEAIVEVS
ncbi:MAG TPA: RidA family protein [Solirubrobacterales bacterium]|nr:RidA family protein [Solirubrobacterales bacterium]